jgi:hypothetical protein
MKHFAKHLAVMALAAGIGLTGTAANATALTLTGNTTSFSDTFSTANPSFTDNFTFIAPYASTGGAVAGSIFSGFPFLSFSSFSLLQGSTTVASGTISGPSFAPYIFASLGPVGLTAGTAYDLQIKGSSPAGGGYSGSLILSVPEPSTWAMMLGGLGLIGFMSYRRRQYF